MGASHLHLKATEREAIESAAAFAGLVVSEWMRQRLLKIATRELAERRHEAPYILAASCLRCNAVTPQAFHQVGRDMGLIRECTMCGSFVAETGAHSKKDDPERNGDE